MIVALLLLIAQAPADSQPGRVQPPEANADRQSLEAKCLEVVAATRESNIDPDTAAVIRDESRNLVERISRLPRRACCLGWTAAGGTSGCLATGLLGCLLWPPPPGVEIMTWDIPGSTWLYATAAGCLGGAGIAATISERHYRSAHDKCREDVTQLVERLNRAHAAAREPPSPPGDN